MNTTTRDVAAALFAGTDLFHDRLLRAEELAEELHDMAVFVGVDAEDPQSPNADRSEAAYQLLEALAAELDRLVDAEHQRLMEAAHGVNADKPPG